MDKELIKVLDEKNMTFPLTSSAETILLKKIFSSGQRFSEMGKCNTGEIDMTFCKEAFTNNPNDSALLKGAIIDRYLLRKKMSQGEILYIDESKLSKIKTISKDLYANERIVLQGITGVNEKTRLKMMIIKNAYCANSLNYLTVSKDIGTKFLLGIFNSKLMNFVFSKFSTNSNVNGYEIDNLPIPRISIASQRPFELLVDQILSAKQSNPDADITVLEKEIDKLVYELYGLTEAEIAIVENSTKI